MAVNFQINSIDRKYKLWWDKKSHDSIYIKLFHITPRGRGKMVWRDRSISANYHDWYDFSETIKDGLYVAEFSDDEENIIREEEIWIGFPGKVTLSLKEWEQEKWYQIRLRSDFPLTRNDYTLRTAKRASIKGTALTPIFGDSKQYEADFLLKIDDLSSFSIVLSGEMRKRMGEVEIVMN